MEMADAAVRPPFRPMDGNPQTPHNGHCFTIAMPGTGKTVLDDIEVIRLAREHPNLTIFVLDIEGDRADRIITWLEREEMSDRWIFIREEDLRENLFEPASIDPVWFMKLAGIFDQHGMFGEVNVFRMREFFMNVNGAGEFQRRGGWATLKELVDHIRTANFPRGGKLDTYRQTIHARLEGWLCC
jgi:hypothetical protein